MSGHRQLPVMPMGDNQQGRGGLAVFMKDGTHQNLKSDHFPRLAPSLPVFSLIHRLCEPAATTPSFHLESKVNAVP
jgi:hypothetical protein